MSTAWFADDNVTKSNIIVVTRNAASDADQQAESDLSEIVQELEGDLCSVIVSDLRKGSYDDAVASDMT